MLARAPLKDGHYMQACRREPDVSKGITDDKRGLISCTPLVTAMLARAPLKDDHCRQTGDKQLCVRASQRQRVLASGIPLVTAMLARAPLKDGHCRQAGK
jgi:hypothetical protein